MNFPENLYFYPITKYVRECRIDIEPYQHERHFGDYHIRYDLGKGQCEIEMSLAYPQDHCPDILFDFGSNIYLRIINRTNIFEADTLLTMMNTSGHDLFFTDDLRFIATDYQYQKSNLPDSALKLQVLVGSETKDPAWLNLYDEGKVELRIELNEGSILL